MIQKIAEPVEVKEPREKAVGKQGTKKVKIVTGNYNGLPYEGPVLHLKETDPDSMKPRLQAAVKVRVFDLDDTADIKDYEAVYARVALGQVRISLEEIKEHGESWKVLLRWMELSYTTPEDLA